LLLFKSFLGDKLVASVAPTSGFAVRRILSRINFAETRLIIEYGPGTGVFTACLLEKMRPDARLILIEQNDVLCQALSRYLADPRVKLFKGKVEDCFDYLWSDGGKQADYIISGIPFTFLAEQDRQAVVKNSHRTLKEGGMLFAYQTFCQPFRHLGTHLKAHFEEVNVMQEVRNLPPLRIFQAIK